MDELARLARTLEDIYTGEVPEIPEIRRIIAIQRVLRGEDINQICQEFRLQRWRVESLIAGVRREGLVALASGYQEHVAGEDLRRRSLGIAQMLLGTLAEKRFEQLADEITGGGVLRIEDHRPSRTDTDYRLLNGQGNPICRLNIKFHGTLFRDARRYVGLDPEDCFALATYKIRNALRRQEEERLPYVFLVLSVRDLSAGDVAALIPEDYVWALAALEGRRALEEAIVARLGSMTTGIGFGRSRSGCQRGSFGLFQLRRHTIFYERGSSSGFMRLL